VVQGSKLALDVADLPLGLPEDNDGDFVEFLYLLQLLVKLLCSSAAVHRLVVGHFGLFVTVWRVTFSSDLAMRNSMRQSDADLPDHNRRIA
jgi:hypothetical protein